MIRRWVHTRYRILRRLGRGTTGEVFLAEDLARNRQKVAIKVLSSTRQGPGSIEQLKYEFEALSRLRHPNLVGVYEFGTISPKAISKGPPSELPFFSMEYMEAGSLRKAIRKLSVPQVAAVIAHVCRALEYLHRQGVVHQDLKPDNILLGGVPPARQEVAVKLGDFGLARLRRHDVKIPGTPGTGICGTPAYLAPEQILGQSIDGRADLYALGVTLYEVLTGRLPFTGRTLGELFLAHLKEAPVPARHTMRALPRALEKIILRLLEKRPQDRFATANEVIAALNRALGTRHGLEGAEAERVYSVRGSFVGREHILQKIRDALEEASHKGTGRFFLVLGQAGMGKSRLLEEIRLELALGLVPAAQVHGAGTRETSGPSLPGALSELSWSAPTRRAPPSTRPNLRSGLAQDEAGRSPVEGIKAALSGFGKRRWALLVDDLPGLGPEEVAALEELSVACRSKPVVVVAAAGAEEAPGPHDVVPRENWRKLQRCEAVETLALAPLANDEVARLAGSMLGARDLPADWAEWLCQESMGNPLLAEELVKSLLERGQLRQREGKWIFPIARDRTLGGRSLEPILRIRLEPVPEAERKSLRALSLASRPASASELAFVLFSRPASRETAAVDAFLGLRDLVQRGFAKGAVHDGMERFSCSSRTITALLEREVPQEARRELHHRWAQCFEEGPGRSAPGASVAAAWHRLRAIQPALRAVQTALQAVETAPTASRAPGRDEIREALERSLSVLEEDAATGAAIEEAPSFRGLLEEILEGTTAENLGDSRIDSLLVEGWQRLGSLHWKGADLARAQRCWQQAFELARRLDRPNEQVELGCRLGTLLLAKGELEGVLRWADRAIDCAASAGDPKLALVPSVLRARALLAGHKFEEAVHEFERAYRLADPAGKPEEACELLLGIAEVHSLEQRTAEAEAAVKRALGIAEVPTRPAKPERSLEPVRARCLDLLGSMDLTRGLLSSASEKLAEAQRLWVRLDRPMELLHSALLLGSCFAKRGDRFEAEQQARSCVKLAKKLGTAAALASAQVVQGMAWLDAGKYRMAKASLEKAVEGLRMIPDKGALPGALLEIGRLCRLVRQANLALRVDQEARELARQFRAAPLEIESRAAIGLDKAAGQEPLEGIRQAEQALAEARSKKLGLLEAQIALELGRIYIERGEFLKAFYLVEKIAQDQGMPLHRGFALALVVHCLVELQNPPEAARHLEELERAAVLAPELDWQWRFLEGRIASVRKQSHRAAQCFQGAMRTLRRLSDALPREWRESYLADPLKQKLREALLQARRRQTR